MNMTEKPLENLVQNGGFARIFKSVACVGDSLSSGEFESIKEDGTKGYYDMFEYSWGQVMGRTIGAKVYNFSRGGMTAREYVESYADLKGFWDEEKKCQAYIFALGVNDTGREVKGSVSDICLSDYRQNGKTFVGYYASIIQRYKEMQPRARFFLVTMPRDLRSTLKNMLPYLTKNLWKTTLWAVICLLQDMYGWQTPLQATLTIL